MQKINKRAKLNFSLLEKYECGLVLNGGEVKAIRRGNIDLGRSWAKIISDEAYLINANIPVEGKKDYDTTRTRKLLLHKDQIVSLKTKIKAKKLTLVPYKVYTKGPLIKAEIALAKAKKKYQKKEDIKRKDIEREIQETLKHGVRNI